MTQGGVSKRAHPDHFAVVPPVKREGAVLARAKIIRPLVLALTVLLAVEVAVAALDVAFRRTWRGRGGLRRWRWTGMGREGLRLRDLAMLYALADGGVAKPLAQTRLQDRRLLRLPRRGGGGRRGRSVVRRRRPAHARSGRGSRLPTARARFLPPDRRGRPGPPGRGARAGQVSRPMQARLTGGGRRLPLWLESRATG